MRKLGRQCPLDGAQEDWWALRTNPSGSARLSCSTPSSPPPSFLHPSSTLCISQNLPCCPLHRLSLGAKIPFPSFFTQIIPVHLSGLDPRSHSGKDFPDPSWAMGGGRKAFLLSCPTACWVLPKRPHGSVLKLSMSVCLSASPLDGGSLETGYGPHSLRFLWP